MPHTLVIIDDHEMMRRGLSSALAADGKWLTIGEAAHLAEARKLFENLPGPPDLIILDRELKTPTDRELGLDMLPWLKERYGSACPPTLVYSVFDGYAYIKSALDHGARGYLSKTAGQAELEAALEELLQGRVYIDKSLLPKMILTSNSCDCLTKREWQVLGLVQDGYSNRRVAKELGIRLHSVENYLSRLYDKLNLNSRDDLIGF